MPAPDQEEAFPEYAHGLAEWKEACSACKSAVKYILAEAAAILTAAALGDVTGLVESVGAMVSAAATGAGERPVPAATHALDVRPRPPRRFPVPPVRTSSLCHGQPHHRAPGSACRNPPSTRAF